MTVLKEPARFRRDVGVRAIVGALIGVGAGVGADAGAQAGAELVDERDGVFAEDA